MLSFSRDIASWVDLTVTIKRRFSIGTKYSRVDEVNFVEGSL